MSIHAPNRTPQLPSQSLPERLGGVPLEISPRPVSIRSLDYRRAPGRADVIDRVRGEFVEMRGFSPTVEQAARLFDLSRDECGRILGGLVQEGFLRRTSDGRYRLPA